MAILESVAHEAGSAPPSETERRALEGQRHWISHPSFSFSVFSFEDKTLMPDVELDSSPPCRHLTPELY
jgi:hypothetical protein